LPANPRQTLQWAGSFPKLVHACLARGRERIKHTSPGAHSAILRIAGKSAPNTSLAVIRVGRESAPNAGGVHGALGKTLSLSRFKQKGNIGQKHFSFSLLKFFRNPSTRQNSSFPSCYAQKRGNYFIAGLIFHISHTLRKSGRREFIGLGMECSRIPFRVRLACRAACGSNRE
jgi:hypothetical protein